MARSIGESQCFAYENHTCPEQFPLIQLSYDGICLSLSRISYSGLYILGFLGNVDLCGEGNNVVITLPQMHENIVTSLLSYGIH